jgi:hypothetical protein
VRVVRQVGDGKVADEGAIEGQGEADVVKEEDEVGFADARHLGAGGGEAGRREEEREEGEGRREREIEEEREGEGE